VIRHKHRVPASRPDDLDATMVHGIADWGAPHVGPDSLAYLRRTGGNPIIVPRANMPDTEIVWFRSRYDFTYVDQVRLVVGVRYGNAKIGIKHSIDLVNWYWLDGLDGPYITETQPYATDQMFVSPWTDLAPAAKGDRWIAPFYKQNVNAEIIVLLKIQLQAR
jgi:hypothetical protein